MRVIPCTFAEACQFVNIHHRHHKAGLRSIPSVPGHMFSVKAVIGDVLWLTVGVAIVGRPVARRIPQDGSVLEVTRLCTFGTRNAASMLYAAAWRAARHRDRGARAMITYTMAGEHGVSIVAAGGRRCGSSPGGQWSKPSRARREHSTTAEKTRWCWGDCHLCIPPLTTHAHCAPVTS